jgi:Protein of unknown function (DUF3396)
MKYDLEEIRKLIDIRIDLEKYPEENGWQSVLCADIVFYFDGWTDTLKLNADGLMAFYTQAMEMIGPDMRWVLINGEGKFRKINKKMFEMLPFWISPEGPDQGSYGVNMQGGVEKNGRVDKSFVFHRSAGSFIRLTLPVEYMLEDLARFAKLGCDLGQRLRFTTGSAGFSVNLTPGQWQWLEGEHIYMLSRRFSGLDLGVPASWSKYAIQGLKTVNWLTFLSDGIAQGIGGQANIKTKLSDSSQLTELDYGVMIQAGLTPLLGDVNLQEDMRAYSDVARLLKPISLPGDTVPSGFWVNGGEVNTHRWLNRFHLPNWGL